MKPFVDGLRRRGIEASAIDLPKRKAEEALPAFHRVVPDDPTTVVGGHSYGGRVASLATAEPGSPYAALILFSFPLHPPGSPDRTAARTAHFPDIGCPALFLSANRTPSRASSCSAMRSGVSVARSSCTRTRRSVTGCCRCSTTRLIASPPSCRPSAPESRQRRAGRGRQRVAITSISTRIVGGQRRHADGRPCRRRPVGKNSRYTSFIAPKSPKSRR